MSHELVPGGCGIPVTSDNRLVIENNCIGQRPLTLYIYIIKSIIIEEE